MASSYTSGVKQRPATLAKSGKECANGAAIEQALADLRASKESLPHRRREFWAEARRVSEMLKTLRPVSPEDLQRLTREFRELCRAARQEQKSEKLEQEMQSRRKRALVEEKILAAQAAAEKAHSLTGLLGADLLLTQALERIADGWKGFDLVTSLVEAAVGDRGKLLREDRQACWKQWRLAERAIRESRLEIWTANYHRLRREAEDAAAAEDHRSPQRALAHLRQVHVRLKAEAMTKTHRRQIRDVLSAGWKNWLSRVRKAPTPQETGNHGDLLHDIARATEHSMRRLEKNEAILAMVEGQTDRLEEEARKTRTYPCAERVRRLIHRKYTRILEIRRTSREIQKAILAAQSAQDG